MLIETEFGYGIVNKKKQMVLSISDDDLLTAIIQKKQMEGHKVYSNILEAYADI